MNHNFKTEQPDQPAKDIPSDKTKAEQPIAAKLKSPNLQTTNHIPARADSLFTLGKRHV